MVRRTDEDSHEMEQHIIEGNVRYVESLGPLAQKAGSYAILLSGSGDISRRPPGQRSLPDEAILRDLGIYEECSIKHPTPGFTLRTMRGFNTLLDPDGFMYKFYLSLDLTNQSQVDLGSQFYREIVEKSQERGIVLASKYWTHAYDSLNLYTITPDHTDRVAEILGEVYPGYAEKLFSSTPHFFQGRVPGIREDHIGFVQEVPTGLSHSHRMRELGKGIDAFLPHRLTVPTFTTAAHASFVNPAKPWLLYTKR